MPKVLIKANDNQHLLEVIETLQNRRSWLTIISTCSKRVKHYKIQIMAKDDQHVLEATLLHCYTNNVNKTI